MNELFVTGKCPEEHAASKNVYVYRPVVEFLCLFLAMLVRAIKIRVVNVLLHMVADLFQTRLI